MKHLRANRHPKLLFRSYLLLVGGLLAAATVLDFSFGYLQARLAPADDPWLERHFRLIEAQLAAVPVESRDNLAASLGADLGVGVQLLYGDDFVATIDSDNGISRLLDASGRASYLRSAPSIAASIRLGPLEAPQTSILPRLLTPLFYLSVFVIVGLWLRPLLRDLNLMTEAAQRFAADYREPPVTARHATRLTSLAKNFDEMSARLSSLIQTQKELAAALSHEMRTPLTRIRFALAIAGRAEPDELERHLQDINADVQELDQLIAAILNYARLDHPDLRMNWQRTPLEGWLEQALEKSRQGSKCLEVVCCHGLDSVWMDPRLMALALSNLVVNASRYADQRIKVTMAADQKAYRLTVEDDGEGIPEAERESVFKAFARLDTSRNRNTGGHGLGLAVVARVAALHGGNVAVDESAALGGARFTLRWHEPS